METKYTRVRQKRKEQLLCLHCGKDRDGDTQVCSKCLQLVRGRDLRRGSASTHARRAQLGLCPRCGGPREDTKTCRACLNQIRSEALILKQEVMAAYGGRCACCPEAHLVFLSIDHIDGSGSTHRKTLSGSGSSTAIYRWLKAKGFPAGFRVLCFNCNMGRYMNGGKCPHEEMRDQQSVCD